MLDVIHSKEKYLLRIGFQQFDKDQTNPVVRSVKWNVWSNRTSEVRLRATLCPQCLGVMRINQALPVRFDNVDVILPCPSQSNGCRHSILLWAVLQQKPGPGAGWYLLLVPKGESATASSILIRLTPGFIKATQLMAKCGLVCWTFLHTSLMVCTHSLLPSSPSGVINACSHRMLSRATLLGALCSGSALAGGQGWPCSFWHGLHQSAGWTGFAKLAFDT